MKLFPPATVSRGLVRVDRGEDFVETFAQLAAAAGWLEAVVSGAGTLDLCELQIGGTTQTFESAAILSLSGRFSRQAAGNLFALHATILVQGRAHSGQLMAAMAGEVTLAVDAHAASVPHAHTGQPSGSATTEAPTPTPTPTPAVPRARTSSPSFGSPMTKAVLPPKRARSFGVEQAEEDENPDVEPGNFLQHPQLGLCEVVGDDGSGGTKIRLASGKSRTLRLEALKVVASKVDESGRTVFAVLGPRRR